METNTPPPVKKGLGALAWIGIGCGGIVVLAIIGFVIMGVTLGGKAKQLVADMEKDPTKATASLMVSASFGQIEMVEQDEVGKRYTVKTKADGKLMTIYWDEATKTPVTIEGDFSKIPAAAPAGAAPVLDSAPVPAAEPAK